MLNASTTPPLDAPLSQPSLRQLRRHAQAFTLVEVVLAIGVIAFAFVGIFSLLPAGLGLFREGMDASISAQIAQRIVSEVEQSDFDALVPEAGNIVTGVTVGGSGSQFYALPLRYFDDQGTELGVGSGDGQIPTLTGSEMQRVVYTARVRGSLPGAPDPSQHDNDYFTSLPASTEGGSADASRFNPRFVTFLTIQIAKNPGRLELDKYLDPASFLITRQMARERNLPVKTFPAIVARNAYRNAD